MDEPGWHELEHGCHATARRGGPDDESGAGRLDEAGAQAAGDLRRVPGARTGVASDGGADSAEREGAVPELETRLRLGPHARLRDELKRAEPRPVCVRVRFLGAVEDSGST